MRLILSPEAPYIRLVATDGSVAWPRSYNFLPNALVLGQDQSVSLGALLFVMQGDGNLVLYDHGKPSWSSGTSGQNCSSRRCVAIFQGDGNFVIYNGSAAIWNSGTAGHPDAQLILSNESPHLQIVASDGSLLWPQSFALDAGSFVLAQNKTFNFGPLSFVMQGDGNLVLYKNGAPMWSSNTQGQNCTSGRCVTVFQGDGNLVVYNGQTPLWNSRTQGHAWAQLTFSAQFPYVQIVASGQTLWRP
jgi:hypothetical protein